MAADDELDDEVELELEEELDEELDPEDLDEELVDGEEDAFALDEDAIDDDALDDTLDEDDADDRGPRAVVAPASDEDDDDLEMVNEDDVEADLDTILKDRLSSADAEDEIDEDEPELDDRGVPTERLAPRREDERLCSTCFLLVRQGAPNCPMGDDDCPLFS